MGEENHVLEGSSKVARRGWRAHHRNCEDSRDVVGMYRAFIADGEFERVWIEDIDGKEVSPGTFGIEEAS